MRTLIDTISDKRFTQNPNNINADDYEVVNITSIDTDDFFVFQKLYSKNEGSSGLEYYRLLLTPYDEDSVRDTPFVKVVDDMTNFLNLSKKEIHERHDYIDVNNEDFIDFIGRAYFIKNPINIPNEYKKPLTVKKEDVFNDLSKTILSGEAVNPNFNYTIDLVNEDIFRDTNYIIEPAEVIFHGENKIFDINNISYFKNDNMNLYNGNTHFNLIFHNRGINMQDRSFNDVNISYDKDLNTFTYKLNNPFTFKMSDFKFFDKMLRRFPYVLNTAVERIDNPNAYNINRMTSNEVYPNYSNSYYYTKYLDFSKTDYKVKITRNDKYNMNTYNKLTKENYDSSIMNRLFGGTFYQTTLIPYHVSGNILTFDLQDDNKYLQLFISNIFPHNMLGNIEYINMASTIYGVRIIDNVYNKYITPYNLNLNVSTHLPYTDHYSRWHVQKVTNYTNNIYNNYRSMSLFNN